MADISYDESELKVGSEVEFKSSSFGSTPLRGTVTEINGDLVAVKVSHPQFMQNGATIRKSSITQILS